MNLIKLFLALIAILCVSMLYAEENTYIKQQVTYKDQGANGKELTWDFGMLSPINEEYTVAYSIPDSNYMHQWCAPRPILCEPRLRGEWGELHPQFEAR